MAKKVDLKKKKIKKKKEGKPTSKYMKTAD